MLNYVTTSEELNKEKIVLGQIFNPEIKLPNNAFVGSFSLFKAFEFDLIYGEIFFTGIQSFIKKILNESFTFYTLSPSPEKYFFKHFYKYSVVKFPLNSTYEDYITFLHKNPGDSPADSLIDNSQTVILYSNNLNWGIIGDKDREIAIVGFKDLSTQNMFLNSFNDEMLFSTIGERAEVIQEMVNLNSSGKKFYSDLERNYSPAGAGL